MQSVPPANILFDKFRGLQTVLTWICLASSKAEVNVCQELPVAAGGVGGPTLRTLQETLIQEIGGFGGRRGTVRVTDGETLELQAAVRGGLWETAVGLFLEHRQKYLKFLVLKVPY